MAIRARTGRAHAVSARLTLKVNVAVHLSLHLDNDAPPDPQARPDGIKDASQRRMRPPRKIVGAKVEIEGARDPAGNPISGVTDAAGDCELDIASVPDGDHIVVITPSSNEDAAPLVSSGAPFVRGLQPSPAFLVAPAGVDFAWRGTRVGITLKAGTMATHPLIIPIDHVHARVLKGATRGAFEVDIKPDWIRDADGSARAETLDMIIVHHTGSRSTVGDLATFTTTDKSVHYLLDRDGHFIKMVNDADAAGHAGRSRWDGRLGTNERSIGIEINHAGTTDDYTPEQVLAVLDLLDQLVTRHRIARHHIVGHEDVGTGDDNKPNSIKPLTQVGRKATDPGPRFPWQDVEALGLGLQLTRPEPDETTMYNGVFRTAETMPLTAGQHVVELRLDLAAIGYSLNNTTDPTYDDHVKSAVSAFQRHFSTLGRARTLRLGIVDRVTAIQIKRCTVW